MQIDYLVGPFMTQGHFPKILLLQIYYCPKNFPTRVIDMSHNLRLLRSIHNIIYVENITV